MKHQANSNVRVFDQYNPQPAEPEYRLWTADTA